MFKSLTNFFEKSNNNIDNDSYNSLEILCGLMLEAANTDGNISQPELNKISSSLINIFKEDPTSVEKSLTKAYNEYDQSKSLYFYTSKINKNFSDVNKILLIEILWEIILSDGELHDYETSLLRRLAGLLYISDVQSGNAKQRALNKIQNSSEL